MNTASSWYCSKRHGWMWSSSAIFFRWALPTMTYLSKMTSVTCRVPGAGDAFCTLRLSGQLNCTNAHRAARESLPVLAEELADAMRQVSPEHRLALHGPDVPQGASAAMPTRIAFVNDPEGPCFGTPAGFAVGHS